MESTTDPRLTPDARRHIESMLRSVAPAATSADRRFRSMLQAGAGVPQRATGQAYSDARIRALLKITPAAAARAGSLAKFFDQVDLSGRRLAGLDVPPADVEAALDEFDAVLGPLLQENFHPAREQFRLATTLALQKAFFQVREAETQAFFGIYEAELQAASLDDMLRRFVGVLTRALRADSGRLTLLEEPAAAELRAPLYIERGDPNARLVVRELVQGSRSCYWSYPVGEGAVLQLRFSGARRWLPRELALLGAAAKRCSEAISRARLEADVRRLHAEALRAEEDVRRSIGRELHDEAGQSLLLLRMQLEMLERDAPEPLVARMAGAREVAERTVTELRRIIAALSPAVLERLGLRAALRHLAARFRSMHHCQLRLRISGPLEGLSRQREEVIYRVVQESLQNIAKHSGASRVMLSLRTADRRIRLRVADNGAGFCADAAEIKPMSFGLAGMRERAALMGGTLAIRSAPGKGATVSLELPPAPVAGHGENTRTLN